MKKLLPPLSEEIANARETALATRATTSEVVQRARKTLQSMQTSSELFEELDSVLRDALHAARNDEALFIALHDVLKNNGSLENVVSILEKRIQKYR